MTSISSPESLHPVRLVVTDDLARRRLTVAFRLLLAVPHLVWLALFGVAASTLAFVVWVAVLIEGRPPRTLHAFLVSYVRYSTHVTAYLCLAAGPYPGFTGSSAYPVDVEVDGPSRQGRLGAGFRLILALPAFVLSSTLAGSVALGAGFGVASLFAFGGLALTIGFLGWFATLVRGRMPRGMRDAAAYACGYAAQVTAYALLVTDRYPDSTPGRALPAPELPAHPVLVRVDDDLRRPRLLVAFRLPLAMPHFFWLTLWLVPATLAALAGWLFTLVRGRMPSALHRFLAAYVRYVAHVTAFTYLVGRPFPGFVGREGSYPIDTTIGPPATQGRLGVLARIVLAIPALVLYQAYAIVLSAVALLGWLAALFRGRMPSGLRDLGAVAIRYQSQVGAYVLLLTPRYPDSSPVLAAPDEPEREAAGEAALAA